MQLDDTLADGQPQSATARGDGGRTQPDEALEDPFELIRGHTPEQLRRRAYFGSSVLILTGVLAMRWNVVIGGQTFSKSLRGIMSYKMEFAGLEGWFMGAFLLALPFIILTVFVKLFLSEKLPTAADLEAQQASAI